MKCYWLILVLSGLFSSAFAKAKPGLGDNIRITSESLGYDLQYRVYLPKNYSMLKGLPVIYVTDGPSYIHAGRMPGIVKRLIKTKDITPVIVVFIDPRDPDNLKNNRRNSEFFCNSRYVDFVTKELVSVIDTNYSTAKTPAKRTILGLSFGGLNSACFGILAYKTFENIAMLSPAMHPVPKIYEYYEHGDKLPLNFFLSTGTIGDNHEKTRRFRNLLKKKGYSLKYKEVRHGHDWNNWKPLLGDVLRYFYGNR